MARKSRPQKVPKNSWAKEPATRYAERVLAGDIVAGKFVRATCQRHISDLEQGHKRGLTFDIEEAARVMRFFPNVLSITAGVKEGEPFELLEWMEFVVGSLFGWRRNDGLRRFRTGWIETGKGQAKSPLMGAIGLYLMGFAGTKRAECYSFATDLKQAKILFSDAVALCRANIPQTDDTLESLSKVIIRGVGANAWRIEHPNTGSVFEPLAATDSLSGYKPVAVFGDEIHEMKSTRAIDLWQAAIDKMPGDPLMLLGTNTPAMDQAVGSEYSQFYQRVATGEIEDDAKFSYIARVDEDDEPFEDESSWIKALPALGITYPIENVRKRVETAKHIASERLATERLFFGIPVGSSGFWIDEASWKAALGPVDPDPSMPCFLGLDLAQKNDLTALSACWRNDGDKLEVKSWYWTTQQGLDRREAEDRTPYRAFAVKGDITALQTEVIDYTFVAAQIAEMVATYEVDSLTVDPAMLSSFMDACNQVGLKIWRYMGEDKPSGQGLKIVTHAQGNRIRFEDKQLCMPHSITRLTDKILAGEVRIEENSMTKVCAANAVLQADGMGNQFFDKARSRGRIDGMVSMAMAVGASKGVAPARKSYLETGGVMFT